MSKSPSEILQAALVLAKSISLQELTKQLPHDALEDIATLVNNGEASKGVLTVVITSIVHKILDPAQDVRYHQDSMPAGYAGRTFDTKYVTPFIFQHFQRFAMRESGWLTRSLEQPHPYTLDYSGHIRNKPVKRAFLNTIDRVERDPALAALLLPAIFRLLLDQMPQGDQFPAMVDSDTPPSIIRIIRAVKQHFFYSYTQAGAARLPVLAIYAVYQLIVEDIKRYKGKSLDVLLSHTTADLRSKSLGDIQVLNSDGSVFEAIEVKHLKPIDAGMIRVAFDKFKGSSTIDRYYLLTTNEPNLKDEDAVMSAIDSFRPRHPCQIVVNGILPSLKYYLRLVEQPSKFLESYSRLIEQESKQGRIKSQHAQTWNEILRQVLAKS